VGQSAAGKNVSKEADDIVMILRQATAGEDTLSIVTQTCGSIFLIVNI
jgi:hypothetical protein